jgi:hypothetical protein
MESQFLQGIKRLSDAYDKEVSERKTNLWWEKLRNVNSEVFHEAVEYIIDNQERFPSLPSIWANIAKVKNAKEIKSIEKQEKELKAKFEANPPHPKYLKEAVAVTRAVFKGKGYYPLSVWMDKRWPGRGWIEEAQRAKERIETRERILQGAKELEVEEVDGIESVGKILKEGKNVP